MCEKEIQLIAIICLFDFVCGTQNLVSSFDFQEGHLDNPGKGLEIRKVKQKPNKAHPQVPILKQSTKPVVAAQRIHSTHLLQ